MFECKSHCGLFCSASNCHATFFHFQYFSYLKIPSRIILDKYKAAIFVALLALLMWSLQMLFASQQLLNKGQGPNFWLSSRRFGNMAFYGLLRFKCAPVHFWMINIDALDRSATPIHIVFNFMPIRIR